MSFNKKEYKRRSCLAGFDGNMQLELKVLYVIIKKCYFENKRELFKIWLFYKF